MQLYVLALVSMSSSFSIFKVQSHSVWVGLRSDSSSQRMKKFVLPSLWLNVAVPSKPSIKSMQLPGFIIKSYVYVCDIAVSKSDGSSQLMKFTILLENNERR